MSKRTGIIIVVLLLAVLFIIPSLLSAAGLVLFKGLMLICAIGFGASVVFASQHRRESAVVAVIALVMAVVA